MFNPVVRYQLKFMAEMTIRLRVNPQTGKKDIVVDLRSDEDALPQEHEQQHRQLVDKLIAGGVVGENEIGNLVIERESIASTQAIAWVQTSEEKTNRQSEQEGETN
jgi:asparagine synthetase A